MNNMKIASELVRLAKSLTGDRKYDIQDMVDFQKDIGAMFDKLRAFIRFSEYTSDELRKHIDDLNGLLGSAFDRTSAIIKILRRLRANNP